MPVDFIKQLRLLALSGVPVDHLADPIHRGDVAVAVYNFYTTKRRKSKAYKKRIQ